jgi:hypothetical protein
MTIGIFDPRWMDTSPSSVSIPKPFINKGIRVKTKQINLPIKGNEVQRKIHYHLLNFP